MKAALVLLPMAAGLAAFLLRSDRLRRGLLILTALAHAGLTGSAWLSGPAREPASRSWLALDPLGQLFLGITSLLFLVAGNILAAYRTKSTLDVHGLLSVRPASGALWVAGMLAITGTPPFGLFLSELGVLKAALDQGRFLVAAGYLALLGLIFVAMSGAVLRMAHGEPASSWKTTMGSQVIRVGDLLPTPEPWLAIAPPAVLAGLVLLLGVYTPPALGELLRQAAASLGGR